MSPTDFAYNISYLLKQIALDRHERFEIVSANPTEMTLKKMGDWTPWMVTWNAWGGVAQVEGQTCTFRG